MREEKHIQRWRATNRGVISKLGFIISTLTTYVCTGYRTERRSVAGDEEDGVERRSLPNRCSSPALSQSPRKKSFHACVGIGLDCTGCP